MEKIIAALDGLKFSDSTKTYAIELAKKSQAHLVGVFMDDITYTSYKIYELMNEKELPEKKLTQLDEKDKAVRYAAAQKFAKACITAGLSYSIHHDHLIAIREVLHESIYADLLVIDSKETLNHYEEPLPTRFIRDLLSNVQCPVVLVPSQYKPVEKIVLLYDGGPVSVHAIKMFSYMLPSLKHLPVEIISVKNLYDDLHLPDNKLMKEFMKRHFSKATYTVLKGVAKTEIINHLKKEKENILVVLGAYQRGALSRWFKTSMADILVKKIKAPLFIAHNK